jgi:hypothetical protein
MRSVSRRRRRSDESTYQRAGLDPELNARVYPEVMRDVTDKDTFRSQSLIISSTSRHVIKVMGGDL